jgi:predicted DNA-binding transcriptional regulator AlpA
MSTAAIEPRRGRINSAPASVSGEVLIGVPAMCQRLGGIGRSTFSRMRAEGKILNPVSLGRKATWLASEVDEWLRAGAPSCDVWEKMKRSRAKT